MSRYISPKDTAKHVRTALKEAFPGIKFSVRTNTYAGGASIDVNWTDGPARTAVDTVTGWFEGKGPMDETDYCPSINRQFNGQQVHFHADYIHTTRNISEDTQDALSAELAAALGVETLETGKSYPTPELVRTANP